MFSNSSVNWLISALPHVVAGIILFTGGLLAAKLARKIALGWVTRSTGNSTVKTFLVNVLYTSIIILTFIITLTQLGVETSSLVAVIGASTLAIGLSMRDFLANIASGFMIVFIQPFKIGDVVEVNGRAGTVIDINLFITEIQTSSHEAIFIPNSEITKNSIINRTHYDARRLDLFITVDHNNPTDKLKSLIMSVIEQEPLAQHTPAATVGIANLTENGLELSIRVWTRRENYSDLRSNLLENIKNVFDVAGIHFPSQASGR